MSRPAWLHPSPWAPSARGKILLGALVLYVHCEDGHGELDSLGSGGQRLTSAGTRLPPLTQEGLGLFNPRSDSRAFEKKCGPGGVDGGGKRAPSAETRSPVPALRPSECPS